MIGDTQDKILEVLRSIEKKVDGDGGGGSGNVGVQQGGTGVQQAGTGVETNVAVPGEQGPLKDTSFVYTTGENGAQIFNEDFTADGELVFGFTSRVLYVRTDEDVVMEFDRGETPIERVPIPADLGEITLGDGGAGFRADKVRFKLADSANSAEASVNVIAYR
jgi:hypothetical protein